MTAEKLTRKGYTWDWERFHKWKHRESSRHPHYGLIGKNTKVFTMGSCFAQNVAWFLESKGIPAHSFPETTHYNVVSIYQDLKHLLEGHVYDDEDMLTTDDGIYANPFRKPTYRAKSLDELRAWNRAVDDRAKVYLKEADVIIITLGGTEVWRHPKTRKVYLTIPYPDVFNSRKNEVAEYYNLSFLQNANTLEDIYAMLRRHVPQAHIIMTLSPNRMTFTVSDKDVVLATCQGKSILRAAVGELTDKYQENLSYFHSYELVEYATYPSDLLDDQQRHVNSFAVSVVMNEFMKSYAQKEVFDKTEYEMIRTMLKERALDLHIRDISFQKRMKHVLLRVLRFLKLKRLALNLYKRFNR